MTDIKAIRKAHTVLANKRKCLIFAPRFADKGKDECLTEECKNCQMYTSEEDFDEALFVAQRILLEKIDEYYENYERQKEGGNG